MKLDRKKILAIVAFVILILIIILFVIFKTKNDETKLNSIYNEIKLNNLVFKNASIIENNGLYTYTVDIYNNSKKDYKMQYFIFEFYDDKDKIIATMVGYSNENIKANKKVTVNSTIDKDISKSKKIKIKIEK